MIQERDAPSPEEEEPVGSTTTADVVVREVEQSITGWRVKNTTKPNYALVLGLGAVTFLLGSILGVLLAGTVSFWVVGSQGRTENKLYVDAPERTTVLLDGDAVSTEVPLTQGQSHTLEIRVPGRTPWSRVLNPVSGETHVIVVASETPVDE